MAHRGGSGLTPWHPFSTALIPEEIITRRVGEEIERERGRRKDKIAKLVEPRADAVSGTARPARTDKQNSQTNCSDPCPKCSDKSATRTSREIPDVTN